MKKLILLLLIAGLPILASPDQERVKEHNEFEPQNLITNGKGIWVNIWNYPKNIDTFIGRLKKFKIDTVYLQINRSTTEVFYNQKGLDQILKAAHANDIKIIGWSYCYLRNIPKDIEKFTIPALYTSPDGEKLDGMAADIEENIALSAVSKYTEGIKGKLPDDYTLIAIVFSPHIKPQYPWEYIGNNWDVVMPMTYWHGLKNRNEDTVYDFVKNSISNLRKLCKNDKINIHLITDGDRTSPDEVAISLKAAKELNINAGISIYPEHLSSDQMLEEIQKF